MLWPFLPCLLNFRFLTPESHRRFGKFV